MRISSFVRGGAAAVAAVAALSATAAEYPIGKQQIQGGMEIGAVYLQPVTMEPEGMMPRRRIRIFTWKPTFTRSRTIRRVSPKATGCRICKFVMN